MNDMNNSCLTNHLTRHGEQTEMEMLAKTECADRLTRDEQTTANTCKATVGEQ